MNKIGQMLDLIYYAALDSGHANFWNGTSQHKMEHTDSLVSLPLKMKIKRIDLYLEQNAAFTEVCYYHLRLGQQPETDALIHEGQSVNDITALMTSTNSGYMFLLDGESQFFHIGILPIVSDHYQVHTFYTDTYIDMAHAGLYLDFALQSAATAAYPAASGDLQLIVILGVEIL